MLRNTGAAALTPPSSPPTYKAYLRPYWFIQRDNGAYVPVIPVDELPPDIELEEAPRCLNMDDAQGMKFLGKLAFSGQTYSLAQQKQQQQQQVALEADWPLDGKWTRRYPLQHRTCSQTGLRPLILGSTTLPREAPADDAHGRPRSDAKTLKALTSSSPVSTTITRPLPPSGREPDHSKKEYCTYWIRTGECDFTQQGCLFKHEMPDLKTLREKIGISSIPHWYQVKTAIQRRKEMDSGAVDGAGKGVGETPRWLKDIVRKNAREQDAASDSGSSDGEEEGEVGEEMLTPPSSNTSPNSTTMTNNPVANTATRVASTPRLFRAPDFEVKRRREQMAQQTDELDQEHSQDNISLIDLSSAPPSPAPRPAAITSTNPFPPSSSNRHQVLKPLPRPPSVTRATRSISDAQADIVNLMQQQQHSRTTSSPSLENNSNKHNKRHSDPPATTSSSSSKLNFTTTTTATKRKSSALPQMKRYFAPLPTTTTTTTSPTPTPTAKEKEKQQPRAATPAASASASATASGIRATGLRASRHAPPPLPPPPPPPSASNSVIDDDDDDAMLGFAPMSVFADQRRRRRLLEELGMREEEERSGGGGGQGPAAPAAAYIKAGGRMAVRRGGGGISGGGGGAATKVPVKAGGGGGASGVLGASAAAVRGRKARARQVVV